MTVKTFYPIWELDILGLIQHYSNSWNFMLERLISIDINLSCFSSRFPSNFLSLTIFSIKQEVSLFRWWRQHKERKIISKSSSIKDFWMKLNLFSSLLLQLSCKFKMIWRVCMCRIGTAQCENLIIFLPLRFYVKSVLCKNKVTVFLAKKLGKN